MHLAEAKAMFISIFLTIKAHASLDTLIFATLRS